MRSDDVPSSVPKRCQSTLNPKTGPLQGTAVRPNMAHTSQSRPDSGLDFQVDVFEPVYTDPCSFGSGALTGPAQETECVSTPLRPNMAHISQSRPDSGLGSPVNVPKTC